MFTCFDKWFIFTKWILNLFSKSPQWQSQHGHTWTQCNPLGGNSNFCHWRAEVVCLRQHCLNDSGSDKTICWWIKSMFYSTNTSLIQEVSEVSCCGKIVVERVGARSLEFGVYQEAVSESHGWLIKSFQSETCVSSYKKGLRLWQKVDLSL